MKKLFLLLALFFSLLSFGQNSTDIEKLFNNYSMLEIPKGSKFILKDGFEIFNYRTYHKKGKGKKLRSSDYLNEILLFEDYEEKNGLFFLVFSTSKGKIEYNTNKSLNELKSESCINIPYLIFYEDLSIATENLISKRFVKKKKQSDYEILNYPLSVFQIDSLNIDYLYSSIKVFAHYEDSGSSFDFLTSFSTTNKTYCNKNLLLDYFFDKYQSAVNYESLREKKLTEEEQSLNNKEKQLAYIRNVEGRMKSAIEQVKDSCHYTENRKDPFKKIDEIVTKPYSLYSGSFEIGRFNVSIIKYGNQKYLRIYSTDEVGCTNPYKSDRSKVSFKLENGDILNFYHSGDLDCGTFSLLGKLSDSEINKLKKSPINVVRIQGTKYYSDIDNLYWKTFFQDKLDCVN